MAGSTYRIARVRGRELIDSRGRPTVEAEIVLEDGTVGSAIVPSGASTGTHEATELRDGDPSRYGGRGTLRAVGHVGRELAACVAGRDVREQADIDRRMCEADGTPNKSRLGANAILAVSMACARASAAARRLPLHETLPADSPPSLPVPMMNVLNGGAHADNNVEIQEFMLCPVGAPSFAEAIRWGCEAYEALRGRLKARGLSTAVGDEGGFAPDLASDEEALSLLVDAVRDTGREPGRDVALALDVAANELADAGRYTLLGLRGAPAGDVVARYRDLCAKFPIVSIEDGLSEDDWDGWASLTRALGDRIRLVGDDLYVTSPARLRRGIAGQTSNAVLVKLNQVGTVTETIETIRASQAAGWRAVVSHRSGETEDAFIADLAAGTGCGWIKTGAPCRSERVAKYNRLLRIEESLPGRYGGARA